MAIIRWRPFQELDNLFEASGKAIHKRDSNHRESLLATDIYEEKNNILVKMYIPEADPDRLDISVEDNTLKVSGIRCNEKKEKETRVYYRQEIICGQFERIITLPIPVNTEEAKAHFKNNILSIIFPKKSKRRPAKKVAIQKQ